MVRTRKEILPMIDPSDKTARTAPSGPMMLIGDTLAMVRFYSRLPIPALGAFDDPANPPPFARACRMLPLASLLIALPMAVIAGLLSFTHLPAIVSAAIALAVALLSTGALHEDGLADVADGFGGGWTKEKKLEIMKDSRVGSYGVAALGLALIARAGLIAALIGSGVTALAAGLLAAAIMSRTASLALFATLPPARPSGVASAVGQPTPQSVTIAIALCLALTVALLASSFTALATLTALIVVACVIFAFGRLASAQIGGQTGDVVGAAQVLAEIAFLAGLIAL